MNEQKNHTVFEFAFEDAPELMIDKYYIIKLDIMLRPEEDFVVRTYCGTLEAIGELIRCLDQDEQNRHYYESTIAAWEAWQEGDKMALHHVGADVEPLLIPAKELCRSAYLLDEAQWSYTDKFGCTMLASADTADVHQVLLYRGHFFRFARYQFGGLCRVHSDYGWVDYHVDDGGVPGMIYKADNGEIYSRLYVLWMSLLLTKTVWTLFRVTSASITTVSAKIFLLNNILTYFEQDAFWASCSLFCCDF